MNIPAHKVVGDNGKPGQIVDNSGLWDKTLADYITRKSKHDALTKVNNEKKMTFDEWCKAENLYYSYHIQEIDLMRLGWEAGQENK